MAERLNHNIEDNWQSASLQQEDNCLVAFIWLVHVQFMRFERLLILFRGFDFNN